MIVIGIDPGGTTGLVRVDTYHKSVSGHQLSTHLEVAHLLRDLIFNARITEPEPTDIMLVIEDFVGSGQRDFHIKDTIELLGFCTLYAQICGVLVVRQVPQSRKAFVSAAEKRWPKYADRHKKDALAHVISYLVRLKGGEYNVSTFDDFSTG